MDTISKNQYRILKACSKDYVDTSSFDPHDVSHLHGKGFLATYTGNKLTPPQNYHITIYPHGFEAMEQYRKENLNSALLIATFILSVISAVCGVISLF